MDHLWIPTVAGLLVMLASLASVELGISVALIEDQPGGRRRQLPGPPEPALDGFPRLVREYRADPPGRRRGRSGGHAGEAPREPSDRRAVVRSAVFRDLARVWLGARVVAPGRPDRGVALSTTSLAVVYAVLVETGLTHTAIGKLIMAATFVTDFGVALSLAALFVRPTWWLLPFLGLSVVVIWAMRALQPWFFARYGDRVIEPEIKGAFAALLVLMFFAERAQSHAVLPAFVLGLALARVFHEHPEIQRRFRVVAFAFLTPFFFLKGGLNVSLALVWANLGLLGLLFAVKQATKFAGVYPVARRSGPADAMFTTLLMSTGLTFGTISSLYGLNAGILDRAQFSVLITTVVASAVIPTIIAQRWFSPAALQPKREGARRILAMT